MKESFMKFDPRIDHLLPMLFIVGTGLGIAAVVFLLERMATAVAGMKRRRRSRRSKGGRKIRIWPVRVNQNTHLPTE